MTTTIAAVFRDGVFHPTGPVALADGASVELAVTQASPEYQAALRRISEAETLSEMWAAAEVAATFEPDDGYDILEALNRNRLDAGERPILPPTDAPPNDQDRAA